MRNSSGLVLIAGLILFFLILHNRLATFTLFEAVLESAGYTIGILLLSYCVSVVLIATARITTDNTLNDPDGIENLYNAEKTKNLIAKLTIIIILVFYLFFI